MPPQEYHSEFRRALCWKPLNHAMKSIENIPSRSRTQGALNDFLMQHSLGSFPFLCIMEVPMWSLSKGSQLRLETVWERLVSAGHWQQGRNLIRTGKSRLREPDTPPLRSGANQTRGARRSERAFLRVRGQKSPEVY